MQRYQWPGFKLQLLAELQRQQNQTQFCDTLLQTEGISVPAHSCILAALSPYLSKQLSASPPAPSGQKRQLKVQALKAQTLVKLVGLLYSGELEVTGSMEQNDVLSAVHQLGITELVACNRDCGMKEGELLKRDFQSCKSKEEEGRRRSKRLTKQNRGVQSDTAVERAVYCVCEKRLSVSKGTQTDPTCFRLPIQTQASNQEPASSLSQRAIQTQKTSLDQHFGLSSILPISSSQSGTSGDETAAPNRSSDSVTNTMSSSASSSNVMAVPLPLNNNSNLLTSHENGADELSSEGQNNDRVVERRENGEDQGHFTQTDEVLWVGGGHCVEKRQYFTNGKLRGMAKLKQMQHIVEATQISIKVKLRRRTKEEAWEVVNLQDKDDSLAVFTSMHQDDSNQKRPQPEPSNDVSLPCAAPPASAPPLKTSLLQHASTEPAAPCSSHTSESQVPPRLSFSPNQRGVPQSVPLSQPPGPVEDTDEQIEKMLEDIMMGLNILPRLETGSKRPHHPQQSSDQASTSCQIHHTGNDGVQGQVHGAAGHLCCQDFELPIGLSSTNTGQIQQSCSSPSVQLDAVQNQQQQCSLLNQFSISPMGPRSELSHQDMMTISKSQNRNHDVATTSAFNSGVHKLHHPESKEQSSPQDPNTLELLPLANRNQAQSSHSFSLLCMDELRLPPLLSPLASSDSPSQYQPFLSDAANHSGKTPPPPSLKGPSWLTETPACLCFPFSAITHTDSQSGSLPQGKSSKCWEKQPQKDLKLIPQSEGTRTVSCDETEKRTTSPQEAERESNIKKDVKYKQSDTKADAKRRKRNHTSQPDELLPCKQLKVSDGKERQLSLSDCSVSLSSNNVLAKEREMANISSCRPVKCARKQNEPSAITESPEIIQPLVHLRNRSFLRRPEEKQNKPNLEQTSALTSVHTPKRKRGRPRKTQVGEGQESCSVVTEHSSNTVRKEPHINNNVSKDEEGNDKTKRKNRKRNRNQGEVEVDRPKKTSAAASTDNTETDVNQNMNPAGKKPRRPGTVTLKEFQKLIKQQHFKTRKSKESQDKETKNKQTSRKTEGEGKAEDNTPPDNTEGVNKSHSMCNSTFDVNHNQIIKESAPELSKSQQDDPTSSAAEEVTFFDTEQCSLFSFIDLEEEVERLAAEKEQPPRNQLQAQVCDNKESDTIHWMTNGDSPHNQPQEDTSHADFSPCPQKTVQPLIEANGCDKLSGCAQGDVDEDEEEVDILFFSPETVPQTITFEDGLENVDASLEEDGDEEDVREIDVTGDEAD